MKALRWSALTTLAAITSWSAWLLWALGKDMCGFYEQSAIPSPTGTKYAVLALYDCGATTRSSTVVFVSDTIPLSQSVDRSVVHLDDTSTGYDFAAMRRRARSIRAEWSGPETLRVLYDRSLLVRAHADAPGVRVLLSPQEVRRP